jgi:hypothetical protein
METLLKSKRLWKYMNISILDLTDDQMKFCFYAKKDEVVGDIMTYISWEVWFHTNGNNYPHQVWKNLKFLFNKFYEIHGMQLEKEFISLDPHSFDRIEEYLARVKEMQLKLGECGKNYQKKDGKLVKMVLMNLRTQFNVFVSTFRINWQECKEYGKDYTFESFCSLLITDQHRLFDEFKIGGKH